MKIRYSEEYPTVGAALSMTVLGILYSGKSPFQKIDVIETQHFGKVLLIDDLVMLTERDEFIYHEMITHIPLYTHPNPRRVLVIGGGDGGTLREVLKHPEVEHVDLVDIDKRVSEVCLEFFPQVANSLLSEKVTCRYEDGLAYVGNTDQKYDVILIDSTDPISVGEGLFTPEFYGNCNKILNDDGLLINQAESPAYTPDWVRAISQKLKALFPTVYFYQAHIPTYPSGHWLFGFASKRYHPLKDFRKEKYLQHNLSLKYYNKDVHYAAFALPNFVKELVK